MKVFLVLIPFCIIGISCNKNNCKDTKAEHCVNAAEGNMYFSKDTLIAIKNSKDTIIYLKSSILPETTTIDVCDNSCVMSGACHSMYNLTTFTLHYHSIDNANIITVKRTYYKSYSEFESYFDDQYEYSLGMLKYSLVGTQDKDVYNGRNSYLDSSTKQQNGDYLYLLKNGVYDGNGYNYLGFLYLDGEKIVKHIDKLTGDTLDFIN